MKKTYISPKQIVRDLSIIGNIMQTITGSLGGNEAVKEDNGWEDEDADW